MGRPKSLHPPSDVKITATPKLVAYLNALIHEDGFGNSRAEVARNLVWRMIEQLRRDGIIKRIAGPVAPSEEGD